MGRPPKPTNLLELTGAFKKNPARRKAREGEPESVGKIGGPPQRFMIFHPDPGFGEAEKLRAIWDNCVALWPWMSPADRDALEHYCKLKRKQDQGNLSGAELTAILRIRSELGGTGTGRARLGIRAANGSPSTPKAVDPRADYMAGRKLG